MSRSLKIDNETHWKSSDILRIARVVIRFLGINPRVSRVLQVRWSPVGHSYVRFIGRTADDRAADIYSVFLPKRGPKEPHENAMIALAASTVRPDAETLAFSEGCRVVNGLIWALAEDDRDDYFDYRNSTTPPDWVDPTILWVSKYKDPKKDGTYREFVASKKKDIRRAEKDIERETAAMEVAKRRLKKAEARKKKAGKALKDAAARRS